VTEGSRNVISAQIADAARLPDELATRTIARR
jgi:hypothetical protein